MAADALLLSHGDEWAPIFAARLRNSLAHTILTGDSSRGFVDLFLIDSAVFDKDSPLWARESDGTLGIFEVAGLRSDFWATHPQTRFAFDSRLSLVSIDLLTQASKGSAAALAEVGRTLLYDIGDIDLAIGYLERAQRDGAEDVALDLAVSVLFTARLRK